MNNFMPSTNLNPTSTAWYCQSSNNSLIWALLLDFFLLYCLGWLWAATRTAQSSVECLFVVVVRTTRAVTDCNCQFTERTALTERPCLRPPQLCALSINMSVIWNVIELFVTRHAGLGAVPHLSDLFMRDLGTRPVWRLAHEQTHIYFQCEAYYWLRVY
jgi:hypothetical protein